MTGPVRAIFVATSLSGGGAERVTSTLLRHQDRTRIRPSLYLLRHQIDYPIPKDVLVVDLRYRGLPTSLSSARRLRRLILRERPDVVLSSVNATNLLTGWALRGVRNPPAWVARIGNSPVGNDRGLRRWVAKRVYPLATRFVANSRGLAGEIAQCYPFTADRIDVIANPTDFDAIDRQAAAPSPIQRPQGGAVVVAVGRLSMQKRYDVMLEAFARVRRTIKAELWVCGDGPQRRALRALADRLEIGESVRWLGFVNNPYAVMRQADLFLMASDHEGLPNALIEALGLGIPAVATRCPHGPDEIVEDGVTGILTPVGDAAGLASAVTVLLQDSERRRGMAASAASRVRQLFQHRPLVSRWGGLLIAEAAATVEGS